MKNTKTVYTVVQSTFRDNKYPFMSTPIGGTFKMKSPFGATTLRKIRTLGMNFSQHKLSCGKILAVRNA